MSDETATWTTTIAASRWENASVEAEVEEAYLEHRDRIYRAVLRSTREPQLAEDVLQDAYLRLLLATRIGNAPDNVPAWLHRVAMNLVIDTMRRRSRAARAAGEERMAHDGAEGGDPDAQILGRERSATLHAALTQLPSDVRHALVLNAAGYGPVEIGAIIGRSGGATRTLLCRARQRTRVLLGDQLDLAGGAMTRLTRHRRAAGPASTTVSIV
jgi:RNA polymerase sigma-70 factor (ECF subfamily)